MDMLLAVVDPSQESIILAEKISALGAQAKKPVYYILNKVTPETEAFVTDAIEKERIISAIPHDERIFMAGLKGDELDLPIEGVRIIADKVAI